jgi:hypothetical protein
METLPLHPVARKSQGEAECQRAESPRNPLVTELSLSRAYSDIHIPDLIAHALHFI